MEAALRERYLIAATDDEEEDPMDLMLPDGKRHRSPVDYQASSACKIMLLSSKH